MKARAPGLRRHPVRRWLRSLALMLLWELRSLRLVLPLAMVVQVFVGAGMAIGVGFFVDEMPRLHAQYLTTGVAVITLITLGLVLAPQLIAQQKAAGIQDYLFSLPVPRTAAVAAGLLVHSAIAVPGALLALAVGARRYDLAFEPGLLVLPACALTLITAASIGFAMAYAIRNPMVTGMLTQVLVFVILLFSPIQYPAERLPAWLATVHRFLPFAHAANVVRAGLVPELASEVAFSFGVLAAWAAGSWAVMAWVVGRRG
ncbi:MAG TPA: ABC transporter permease [Thermoanaerobaculia bacterium]|nr:ABC transporter permease [Thermoanaerobaculia bacterium]